MENWEQKSLIKLNIINKLLIYYNNSKMENEGSDGLTIIVTLIFIIATYIWSLIDESNTNSNV